MVLQDLYLHFSQITCLGRVFLVQYHHFPSTLPRHHTEGREHWCVPLKCSLGQALKPGMWQILDAPLPLPWQGSALTNVGARVAQAAAPGGITPGGSSFSCSFPFLSALHSNLDVGLPAAGALSSASLPRKMDFLQNFPSHFKFLTAALLLPLSHSQHSVAVCAVCPHTAKPISVHYLPLKKNPQTTKV